MVSQRDQPSSPAAPSEQAGLDDELTDALVRTRRFFTRGEVSPDLRALYKTGGRAADAFYRDRWSHDKVVRSTRLGDPVAAWAESRLPLLREVASAAGARVGRPLHRFLDHAASTPQPDLAADYVATFDHRKRCCLFLTYYSHGDTRKRGMALLRLKHSYAAAGLRLTEDELPDHQPGSPAGQPGTAARLGASPVGECRS